jgi:hypothetical protein
VPHDQDGALSILFTDPAEGATAVSRRGPFVIGVDRALDPGTLQRGRVGIESGAVREFLSLDYEPVDRLVIARPFGERALEPNTGYRLVLNDLRGLDGSVLVEPWTVAFRTSSLADSRAEESVAWSEVEALFERCATAGCHAAEQPVLGLDLSSPHAIERTAIGRTAEELQGAGLGAEGGAGGGGLRAWPRIDRTTSTNGRPETSYLLYKAMAEGPRFGERMPPPDQGVEPWHLDDLRLIQGWIRSGAPTQ